MFFISHDTRTGPNDMSCFSREMLNLILRNNEKEAGKKQSLYSWLKGLSAGIKETSGTNGQRALARNDLTLKYKEKCLPLFPFTYNCLFPLLAWVHIPFLEVYSSLKKILKLSWDTHK